MDYQTPGVYIREVDSGPKPIASVATSVPGFLGLFDFNPTEDAVAIAGSDGAKQLSGKVVPQLVDKEGKVVGDAGEATTAITTAFRFKRSQVKDVKRYLELHGAAKSGAKAPKFEPGSKGRVKITWEEASAEVADVIMDVKGKVVTENDQLVEELLNQLHDSFALETAAPKTASDVLEVYGYNFSGASGSAMRSEYSIPPMAITNKAEFFRWLQSFFAQYLLETQPIEDLVGSAYDDPDEAADAVFESLATDAALKKQFQDFLSRPSVFNFVASVNGFYDNGGGKCYVYLMGTPDLDYSIRENQADKLGLYAFDDCDDMAIMATPGLTDSQQKNLEHCKSERTASRSWMDRSSPTATWIFQPPRRASVRCMCPGSRRPSPAGSTATKTASRSRAPTAASSSCEKNEVFVPPSGHIAGIMARVDGERGVHKAPANELVNGITGLTQNINRIEQGQYNDRGINVIRTFKDRGTRVWGARTLATKNDPSWKYINVRRLFIMVEQSIMLGSQWAVFEPNDHTLWKKLTRDVRAYLMRVWRSGALFGQTPEEAFYVKCDDETNPRYLIDAGQVNVQVGICPVKPAEFVIFSIGQWDGGGLIEEV